MTYLISFSKHLIFLSHTFTYSQFNEVLNLGVCNPTSTYQELEMVDIREQEYYLEEDHLSQLKRRVCIYKDLGPIPEGVDVVFELIQDLQVENKRLRRK